MRFFWILMVLNSMVVLGQNQWEIGVDAGSADLFRNENKTSYFDYTLKEYGVHFGKNFAWKTNPETTWKKYWIGRIHLASGKYQWANSTTTEKTYGAQIQSGIRYVRPLGNNFAFDSQIALGAGYHTVLDKRLSEGVFFKENLVVGVRKKWESDVENFVGLGFLHASNANIHPINRGFELFSIHFSCLW